MTACTLCSLVFVVLVEGGLGSTLRFRSNHKWQEFFKEDKPAFCHQLDCPKFTVLDKEGDKYEEREYEATEWATTSTVGTDYGLAYFQNIKRLIEYIHGKNKQGTKIAMAAPVTTKIIPEPGPLGENNFIMSFYLSKSIGRPPTPLDPTVFISSFPEFKAYIRSFGGYILNLQQWNKEAEKLDKFLNGTHDYIRSYYYTASYDSAAKFFNRHNEVWFIAV